MEDEIDYMEGDYLTPPYGKFLGRVASFDEIVISYPDEEYFLNGKEITEIEKEI